jgi:hypothetical protein
MRWDDRFVDLFDDLEQQADGIALVRRDAEVAELARAEYAAVDLGARLHGSLGRPVVVLVAGVGPVEGTLNRVGAGWCLLGSGTQEWLLPLAAATGLRGLCEHAVSVAARPLTARLGVASALRALADTQPEAVVYRRDGSLVRGVLTRVGADFVDLRTGERGEGCVETVPFEAVAAVRSG